MENEQILWQSSSIGNRLSSLSYPRFQIGTSLFGNYKDSTRRFGLEPFAEDRLSCARSQGYTCITVGGTFFLPKSLFHIEIDRIVIDRRKLNVILLQYVDPSSGIR